MTELLTAFQWNIYSIYLPLLMRFDLNLCYRVILVFVVTRLNPGLTQSHAALRPITSWSFTSYLLNHSQVLHMLHFSYSLTGTGIPNNLKDLLFSVFTVMKFSYLNVWLFLMSLHRSKKVIQKRNFKSLLQKVILKIFQHKGKQYYFWDNTAVSI